jgi:hypothetical protein
MNIPGFTAEAALCKMSNCYQMIADFAQRAEIIAPAQFGGMPGPDGPDFPDFPGIPDVPKRPLFRICYYPCHEVCVPRFLGFPGFCFYPCRQRCLWL